jgi:hypothetical protein
MTTKQAIAKVLARLGYRVVRVTAEPPVTLQAIEVGPAESGARPASILKRAENAPPRRCTTLARAPDKGSDLGRFTDRVKEFHEKGITVVPTNPEFAQNWRETEKFEKDVGNRHSAWDWAGNSVKPYSQQLRSGLPSQKLRDDLRQLFSSPDFDSFFRGVLGCPITVANCRLVQSIPHSESGIGPQSWHHDGCPPGVFRGVLYLCDVDRDTGPFQYRDEKGREHEVLGKTGDLLVFDAMRLEHRAVPPKSHMRTAIDLVFMPRLPGQEFQINVAGMNHWPADPFVFAEPPVVR